MDEAQVLASLLEKAYGQSAQRTLIFFSALLDKTLRTLAGRSIDVKNTQGPATGFVRSYPNLSFVTPTTRFCLRGRTRIWRLDFLRLTRTARLEARQDRCRQIGFSAAREKSPFCLRQPVRELRGTRPHLWERLLYPLSFEIAEVPLKPTPCNRLSRDAAVLKPIGRSIVPQQLVSLASLEES